MSSILTVFLDFHCFLCFMEGGRCGNGRGRICTGVWARFNFFKIGAHETSWCTFTLDKVWPKPFCARPHLDKDCRYLRFSHSQKYLSPPLCSYQLQKMGEMGPKIARLCIDPIGSLRSQAKKKWELFFGSYLCAPVISIWSNCKSKISSQQKTVGTIH